MPHTYKPLTQYEARVDPARCLASVPIGGRSVGSRQCLRRPWRDGWCRQHHPESEAKRQEESRQRWESKLKNRPAELADLRAEVERLRGALEALIYEYQPEWSYGMGNRVGYRCDWCLTWIKNIGDFHDLELHDAECPLRRARAALEEG